MLRFISSGRSQYSLSNSQQLNRDVAAERGFAEGSTAHRCQCHKRKTDPSFQLLQEVETQALVSQQKIQQTQGEINAKKREARLNQLTSNELASLTSDTKVYEGVGKMSVQPAEISAVPIADSSPGSLRCLLNQSMTDCPPSRQP